MYIAISLHINFYFILYFSNKLLYIENKNISNM